MIVCVYKCGVNGSYYIIGVGFIGRYFQIHSHIDNIAIYLSMCECVLSSIPKLNILYSTNNIRITYTV